MDKTRTVHRSFSGGELSEDLHARSDLEKYRTGVAEMINWVPTPQGAMHARSGFRYVADARNEGDVIGPVLLPFIFNNEQAFVLEFTDNTMRLYTNGQMVLDGGVPYELVSPYTRAQAAEMRYVQSNDVITFTHHSHPPKLLKRLADDDWVFEDEVFGPVVAKPDAPSSSGYSEETAGVDITHRFKITRYVPSTGRESLPGSPISVDGDLTIKGNVITITMASLANLGASIGTGFFLGNLTAGQASVTYRFYKEESGVFGYIGESALGIDVRNIAPDLGRTPPRYDVQFEAADRYPAAVGYWGQRKVYANTITQPQTHWMTETGTESSLNYHAPSLATDSIQYTLAARQASAIRYVVEHGDLFLLTAGALWRSRAIQDAVVSAGNLEYSIVSNVGAANVRPIETENTVLFVSSRGHTVRELNPSMQLDSPFAVRNLSVLASHLFKGHKITDSGMVMSPQPIALFLRDDGILLGVSYMPEEKVISWFRIDTVDNIGSIAVIPQGDVDEVYVTVRRNSKWRIEQLNFERLNDPDGKDRWHLDSCTTYSGASTSTITGLHHLAGRSVMVVDGDGLAQGPNSVSSGGELTLDNPVTHATIGLKYTAIAKMLPVTAAEIRAPGAKVMVNSCQVQVRDTTQLFFRTPGLGQWGSIEDPDFNLFESDYRNRKTGLINVPVENWWDEDSDTSDLMIIQDAPQPAQVLQLIMNVTVGAGYG